MARKRLNFSLSEETDKLIRDISIKTGLKMSTIVEKAIILLDKELK